MESWYFYKNNFEVQQQLVCTWNYNVNHYIPYQKKNLTILIQNDYSLRMSVLHFDYQIPADYKQT